MKKAIVFLFLLSTWALPAQKEVLFTVDVSTDSILMDNYFEVTFTLENASGKQFVAPSFEDFQVLSGPNTSSSMSIINGDMTQSISYSYYLKPKDIGSYYITPASIEADGALLETLAIEVGVFPNPDGIQQNPAQQKSSIFDSSSPFDSDFFKEFDRRSMPIPSEPKKAKKKKKTTRRI
ncbi:MAG: BatD family protein [Bacteroidota bacterium]